MTERAPGTPPLLVLRKVCQILDCFTVEDPTPTLQQLTRLTGLPSSTCQRLVHNLVRGGFLDRGGDRYRIGMALVRWAAPGTVGLDLVRLVRPDLQRLRDETGETACLYVRDGALGIGAPTQSVGPRDVGRFAPVVVAAAAAASSALGFRAPAPPG